MKLLNLVLVLALSACSPAFAASSHTLLNAATATGYGTPKAPKNDNKTFQAMGLTTAGSGAATVIIYCTNKPSPVLTTDVDWKEVGRITLTLGTTQTNDGFASDAAWVLCRAHLSAISGTNAAVTAYMGH